MIERPSVSTIIAIADFLHKSLNIIEEIYPEFKSTVLSSIKKVTIESLIKTNSIGFFLHILDVIVTNTTLKQFQEAFNPQHLCQAMEFAIWSSTMESEYKGAKTLGATLFKLIVKTHIFKQMIKSVLTVYRVEKKL